MPEAAEVLPGEPMSWDEYERRGENPRSEYIDGRLVMVPQPTRHHQEACYQLTVALKQLALAGHDVTASWNWKVGRDELGPDVMVHPVTDENLRFTGVPLLVVEVLSANPSRDTVVKLQKYARGGALNYWLVDLRERRLIALRLDGGIYEAVAEVDDASGPVDVPLGDSVFRADITTLLGRSPRT